MHGVAVDSYCKHNSHNNIFFDYCGSFVCNNEVYVFDFVVIKCFGIQQVTFLGELENNF